jgi:aminocarboxymuconate-semialdehyde decarboxylase
VIVDVHAHVIVPEVLRDAAPDEAWRPSVRRENGAQVVELGGRAIRSAVAEFVDPAGILAAADRVGVDRIVLSPWVPLLFTEVDAEEGERRCRIQNDALLGLRCDRIGVLGAVPLQDPERAAEMLHGLPGVEIPASVGGDYLGHDRFEPFWAAAEETGAVVFIHPTTRAFDLPGFYLWNTVGNPFETTITAAHMVMAGVMERHPNLRVVLAHGGGALPALRGRLRHAHQAIAAAGERLREPPEDSMRRFYYDTVTHDPTVLRALVEFAGADRVLLGTDHPFDMADPHPVATVRAAGLGADAERAVLGGTAEVLLG